MFNTASDKIVLPKKEFESMVSILNKKFTADNFTCEYQNNICSFATACDKIAKKLKPLSLKLGDDWYFNIPSADLLYTAVND